MIIDVKSREEFYDSIRKYKYVVIIFYSQYCFPSRALISFIKQIHEELYWCVFILVDIDRFPEIAQEFDALKTGTPTRIYMYKGEIIAKDIGSEKDAETLKSIILGIYQPYLKEEEKRKLVTIGIVLGILTVASAIAIMKKK